MTRGLNIIATSLFSGGPRFSRLLSSFTPTAADLNNQFDPKKESKSISRRLELAGGGYIKMVEVPSLFSLCTKAISMQIINGFDHVQELFELPSDFLDGLVMELPPLALQNLHELSLDSCGRREFTTNGINDGRKRGRHDNFNTTWKTLYKKRWPEAMKKMQQTSLMTMHDGVGMLKPENSCFDWQQLYWEAHLQNCLDEAAERALLPFFDGHIGGVKISDSVMSSIGYSGDTLQDCSKLSYHCIKFGRYARCLRLQNVLCVAEICELLRSGELQALVFRRIISKSHVDGVCMLLNQNKESLLSLEFVHCQLSPVSVNQICSSVYKEGTEIHGIQHLCIKSSFIFESKSSSIPAGLSSFLSSGRSLESLYFSDTRMGPKFAKIIFDTLVESSCGLVTLVISDNEIAGWLCKVDRRYIGPLLLLGPDFSLKSLTVLNLRGNNLCKDDAEDLNNALIRMPNLRNIDISDNPIEDDGIRSLIPYFIKALEKSNPISDIKIENCDLSVTGVAELLRSLPMSKEPLNSISIADNDLGSSIATLLVKFLSTSRVRTLNIEDIGLGPLGFQELENAMSKEVEVVNINISKNRGGIRAAYFISDLILHAPNLVSIDAGYNLMPHESLPVIHDALKKSKGKLEHLDLTGNTSLYESVYTPAISEFQFRGKPIVTIPTFLATGTPYDDDP